MALVKLKRNLTRTPIQVLICIRHFGHSSLPPLRLGGFCGRWFIGRFLFAVLVVLYSLGRYRPSLPLRGLTFVAIVFSALGFYLVLHLIQAA
jgi:hypothetical protein